MKAIMVMFDTLNRHMLQPYGCDWAHAPNFERLAKKSVTFDNCYIGSMPCMPTRRELHTGRYNFLHRSWGPIEPFDDSMPEILKNSGVYTHLISDHFHYWEDGGATYHNKYSSWEAIRGQTGDHWKGQVKDPVIPDTKNKHKDSVKGRHDWVNRTYLQDEINHPQVKTFNLGLEFIEKNSDEDRWFLQLETFDPHEPFFTYNKYRELYIDEYEGPLLDWPIYGKSEYTKEEIKHIRYEYAALVTMCDFQLGRVLDIMDEKNMWDDTMLIVNTDHGLLFGEHNQIGKWVQPFYNEVSRIPLFIWDPRSKKSNQRNDCLVQNIDLPVTLLNLFGADIPKDMQGKDLQDTIRNNKPVRQGALYGHFGSHVNYTDGQYVYMRAPKEPESKPLFEYTLMPTHMTRFFSRKELSSITLDKGFSFTKGFKVLKVETEARADTYSFGNLLYNVKDDLYQQNPINNMQLEKEMINNMIKLMKENDAPKEQYERLGLQFNG